MSKQDSIYLRQVRRELRDKLLASCRGWRSWRKLRSIGEKGKTVIVLIPQGDEEISLFALAYLEQMLRARKKINAIIATNDPLVIRNRSVCSKCIIEIKQLTEREISDLLQLCCLYKFDENFIVASLDSPCGRNGGRLIGVKGISKEEIFAVGLYGLYPFPQENSCLSGI